MGIKTFINQLTQSKLKVLAIVIAALAVTAMAVLAQPLKYEARSRLLVVQNFDKNTDPLAAEKSNGYLAKVLSSVATSDAFYEQVARSGYKYDEDYFSGTPAVRDRIWKSTVKASVADDTGTIIVSVYHPDRSQLDQLARAVNYAFKTQTSQYHDRYDTAAVKVIDEPVISDWPKEPDMPAYFSSGLLIGMLLSLVYVYKFPGKASLDAKAPQVKFVHKSEEPVVKPTQNIPAKIEEDVRLEPAPVAPAISASVEEAKEKAQTAEHPKLTYDDIRRRGDMRNVLSV